MKREGPALVAFLTGTLILGSYFFETPAITLTASLILRWRTIISAFALVLGAANMITFHGKTFLRQGKDKWYSLLFLVSFLSYFALGVLKSPSSLAYRFIWENMYQPASATMYSFTLFYMTSACWRAFRIRNWQAAVLMVTGAVVLLGQVGIGEIISPFIPKLAAWIIEVPNAAAIRAITIGGSLGMVVMSMRVILGLEKTYMAGGRN